MSVPENKITKHKYFKPALIGVGIIIVLLSFGFAGNGGYKYVKSIIQTERDKVAEAQAQNIRDIDSLNAIIFQEQENAEAYERLWIEAESQNRRIFRKLKKRIYESSISNDTSFNNNARIIANTVARQFKDSI